MGSTAYDANGDVPLKYSIPWGAVRKAWLKYKDIIHVVTKITLSGVTYNIGKQAKEGLVVIGNKYNTVTFFLPDDRQPMTAEDGAAMSIYDWLEKVGKTDYSVITAWDHFAIFVGDTLRNMAESSETEIPTEIGYTFQRKKDNVVDTPLSGVWDFRTVTTAQEFFLGILSGLDSNSVAMAKESTLAEWLVEDGTVSAEFSVMASENSGVFFHLLIGRK
jgi:hypothetical protein